MFYWFSVTVVGGVWVTVILPLVFVDWVQYSESSHRRSGVVFGNVDVLLVDFVLLEISFISVSLPVSLSLSEKNLKKMNEKENKGLGLVYHSA